jgi:Mrp family chromosome partitioning ATPase
MSMGFFIDDNSPVIWRGPMVHGLIASSSPTSRGASSTTS